VTSTLRDPPVGLAVALSAELRCLCERYTSLRIETRGGLHFFSGTLSCTPVVAVASGMGGERAFEAVDRLIQEFAPSEVVIAGFCAGLDAGVRAGDVVVATEVLAADGPVLFPTPHLLGRVRLAAGCSPAPKLGRVASVNTVLCDLDAKRSVRDRTTALVADMESAGAARACEQAGTPWMAVRSITDGPDEAFPLDFGRYATPGGQPDSLRIALAAAVRPWTWRRVARLGRASALAARNLAAFVEAYVRRLRGETR